MVVREFPFDQTRIDETKFIRVFDKDVLTEELVWHRDRKDRTITVLEGDGWELQLDNLLPIKLEVGDEIFIQAETYHRIKRGTNNLVLQIEENK